MRQWFNDCLSLAERHPESDAARTCFAELAPAFRAGRDLQCQLWDIPLESDACHGRVNPPEPQAAERRRTLELAELVSQGLDKAATLGTYRDPKNLGRLLVAAANSLLQEQRHY
jgi:hypothetical protein